MSHIHFEIFRIAGKAGAWSLVEAMDDRARALERAKQLLESGQAAAVRVVKETLQASTGDYMSLTVFEDGNLEAQKKKKNTGEPPKNPLPCFKPDDLYSYHARMTLARLVGDWLARQKLTVTEMIHSAAALEKFEATGTTYQHAIQKIAVAEAAHSEMPVSQIVKQLNDLCTTAIHRVYKDEKKGAFPKPAIGGFAPLSAKLVGNPEAKYILNGALAKYLSDAQGWDAKLTAVLALMAEIPKDGPARGLLLSAIDTLTAELLNGSAALADLLGSNPDLGHALLNLVHLFLGVPLDVDNGGKGINELARYFASDDLPEARAAIASRILSELRGMKRLSPASLDEELKMLRKLANNLVRGQGKYLSNEELINAFTERSKRLVTHEPLQQYMADAKTPDAKMERLLSVEENIIGAENKRVLATFIMPILSANNFADHLLPSAPTPQRLKRLADLQTRAMRCGFQDIQKKQIAAALDAHACHLESRAQFLTMLENRVTHPVERAQALLKMFVSGIFTDGELSNKAKRLLLQALAKPGFLASYLAGVAQEKNAAIDQEEALSELMSKLEQIGIPPDEGLRVLAA